MWLLLFSFLSGLLIGLFLRRCISWLRVDSWAVKPSRSYPLVEAITGTFFAIAGWRFGFPLTIPIWLLGSLLILTTFLDIESFIIPDVVTKPGIVAGLSSCLFVPELHPTSTRF